MRIPGLTEEIRAERDFKLHFCIHLSDSKMKHQQF